MKRNASNASEEIKKLDKQDNEKMWDFEDIYRSNRLYLAIWEMAHKWLNWLMNDSHNDSMIMGHQRGEGDMKKEEDYLDTLLGLARLRRVCLPAGTCLPLGRGRSIMWT